MSTKFISGTLAMLTMINLISCVGGFSIMNEDRWVEHTLRRLSLRQKVAQMLVYHLNMRVVNEDTRQWRELDSILADEGLGVVHLWNGDPVATAVVLNNLQKRSKVPILVEADLEYGLADRFPGGSPLPFPMGLAATNDPELVYQAGKLTGIEGRTLGIHLALAPVVDVNSAPDNPIINTRSFGEDPETVGKLANAFLQGLHAGGMVGTAKHFPGHGDTHLDTHLELAVIPSDAQRLWRVELKPFKMLIDHGVDAVMIGHLTAGDFQPDPEQPATFSPFWQQEILRQAMGFKGLILTDALGMGAVVRHYSDDYALIQAVRAGADILIQNYDYRRSVKVLVDAVKQGLISEARVDSSVRRILHLKARLGLHRQRLVSLDTLRKRYGSPQNLAIARRIAHKSVTLVKDQAQLLPRFRKGQDTLVVIDLYDTPQRLQGSYLAHRFEPYFPKVVSFRLDGGDSAAIYQGALDEVPSEGLILVNAFCRPKARKGSIFLTERQAAFLNDLTKRNPNIILISFGTPYLIQDAPQIGTYLCAYRGSTQMQQAVADALLGISEISGRLPVTLPGYAERGTGLDIPKADPPLQAKRITPAPLPVLKIVTPREVGADTTQLMPLVRAALADSAWPGGVLLAAIDGKIFFYQGFGYHTYAHKRPTRRSDIFDLASITKVVATTSAVMHLVDEGKLQLDDRAINYLPEFTGPDSLNTFLKNKITIRHLLTHSAGLPPFRTFYKMDAPTTEALWDTLFQTALDNPPGVKEVYSDIGMMLMGKIVERVSGMPLDHYVAETVFQPLHMQHTFFNPPTRYLNRIVPTEYSAVEKAFVHGHVHDENAYRFGGVCGHAGLFSTAMDLARFAQMMLNHGRYGDTTLFDSSTVTLFTRRANLIPGSSRCLGWDSPSDASSGGPYLSSSAFGHTGFTGTSMWIDPSRKLFVILLTNAVHPDRTWKKPRYYDWRQRIHAAVYESLGIKELNPELRWRSRWQTAE